MDPLAGWQRGSYAAADIEHTTYRKGSGPGVIVIHEMPGLTPDVIAFAEEVVTAGHTVVLPSLFGTDGAAPTPVAFARALGTTCINKEFVLMARGRSSPVTAWLRSLARELHTDVGGPGVGAVGMCFTGGFVLAMMLDDAVVAPVAAQPSLPFAVGRARSRDLGLSPADLEIVTRRAERGCAVLGLRFEGDPASGGKFETLRTELGDNFIAVEFPGRKHSTLTHDRQQDGVDRVLEFLAERLAVA